MGLGLSRLRNVLVDPLKQLELAALRSLKKSKTNFVANLNCQNMKQYLDERLVLVLELLGVDLLLLGEGLEALVVAVEDVLEEAGEDHAGGGAALAHLAVEDARRVGVLLPHLGEHRVEVDLAGGLLVHDRQPGDGLSMFRLGLLMGNARLSELPKNGLAIALWRSHTI